MKMSFTTFACPNWSLRQIVRAAAKHQYNGIEFRIDAGHAHAVEAWTSPTERRRFREQIEKEGLVVSCIASSLQFVVEGMVEQAVARVQLAADMGAPGLRVFFGQLPEGMTSIDEAVDRVTRQLREAAETAHALDVELWIETHDMLCKGADAAAIIHAIDRPNVGVCYNNLHPIRRGESLETTIAHLAPMIRHVHLHDGLNWPDKVIITPFGQGDMPLDDTVTALRNIGYDRFLSGEWFHNQYGDKPEDAIELYSFEVRTLTHKLGVGLGLG